LYIARFRPSSPPFAVFINLNSSLRQYHMQTGKYSFDARKNGIAASASLLLNRYIKAEQISAWVGVESTISRASRDYNPRRFAPPPSKEGGVARASPPGVTLHQSRA
jgi:hypothetical protein